MTRYDFLKQKFSRTGREVNRPQMEPIPDERHENVKLSREEFDRTVHRLNSCKAAGPDGISAEVYNPLIGSWVPGFVHFDVHGQVFWKI